MHVNDRIMLLQTGMIKDDIKMYYIPTSDYHHSEYVDEHFKARAFMSGFTGSSGDLLITQDAAYLWSDGRYYIQAAQQLKDTCIKFMKSQEADVLSPTAWIIKHAENNSVIGFDGKVVPYQFYLELNEALAGKGVKFQIDRDRVEPIWKHRPPMPNNKAYELSKKYSGTSSLTKIKKIIDIMERDKNDIHVIASLDDIAWILNMRGNDIPCFPVAYAFLLIAKNEVKLYLNQAKIDQSFKEYLGSLELAVLDYEEIFTDLKQYRNKVILIDPKSVSTAIVKSLDQSIKLKFETNISQKIKAIKNPIEIANTRLAHIKDGVAMSKFMYWFKHNIGKIEMSEISIADKILELRKEQDTFISCSFDTIAAYREHGALMHYSANESSNAKIGTNGLLLIDSGGQYFDGTTDITRTLVCQEISDEEKLHFTLSLQGMIALSNANFLEGARGFNLDILARQPIWEHGLNYLCGTGHGVGHVLNVHEGPVGFRWKLNPAIDDSCELEAGMITSNEPGIYIENSHGVRHENEMLICDGVKNEYGQFRFFETLTFVPFDLEGIAIELLSPKEIAWLNNYHQQVYEKIAPYLNAEEQQYLKVATRKI